MSTTFASRIAPDVFCPLEIASILLAEVNRAGTQTVDGRRHHVVDDHRLDSVGWMGQQGTEVERSVGEPAEAGPARSTGRAPRGRTANRCGPSTAGCEILGVERTAPPRPVTRRPAEPAGPGRTDVVGVAGRGALGERLVGLLELGAPALDHDDRHRLVASRRRERIPAGPPPAMQMSASTTLSREMLSACSKRISPIRGPRRRTDQRSSAAAPSLPPSTVSPRRK